MPAMSELRAVTVPIDNFLEGHEVKVASMLTNPVPLSILRIRIFGSSRERESKGTDW